MLTELQQFQKRRETRKNTVMYSAAFVLSLVMAAKIGFDYASTHFTEKHIPCPTREVGCSVTPLKGEGLTFKTLNFMQTVKNGTSLLVVDIDDNDSENTRFLLQADTLRGEIEMWVNEDEVE